MSLKRQHIINCSLPCWYPHFKAQSIKTEILKIPAIFLDYLLADGVYLPDCAEIGGEKHSSTVGSSNEEQLNQWSDDEFDHDDVKSELEKQHMQRFQSPDFKEFAQHVKASIVELGGQVMPKLNWSAPRDASWITTANTLCCQSFQEICLVLKSSEFITHDLTDPFRMCSSSGNNNSSKIEHYLCLRKWKPMTPSGEFRCFIQHGKLSAISQRHQAFYPHVHSDRDTILTTLCDFYSTFIKGKFPDPDVVVDMYLPGDSSTPVLIDFNPYCEVTDSLLFDWEELQQDLVPGKEDFVKNGVVFRYIRHPGHHGDGLGQYAYPLDIQHLASGEDPAKLIDLLKLHQRQQSDDSD